MARTNKGAPIATNTMFVKSTPLGNLPVVYTKMPMMKSEIVNVSVAHRHRWIQAK